MSNRPVARWTSFLYMSEQVNSRMYSFRRYSWTYRCRWRWRFLLLVLDSSRWFWLHCYQSSVKGSQLRILKKWILYMFLSRGSCLRVEVDGLFLSNYTLQITIFVSVWNNLGQWICYTFCQNESSNTQMWHIITIIM